VPSSLSAVRSRSVRLIIVLLAGLLAAGVLSSSARAETAGPAGRVSGLVLDRSNQPLAGATVTLTNPDAGVVAASTGTDGQGRWSLSIPQGDYDLQVSVQQGDHTLSANVRRYAVGADTKLNLILAGDPDEAASVRAAAAESGSAPEVASPAFTRAAAMAQSSSGSVTFSGQVLGADGDPVGTGVSIWLSQPNAYRTADVMVSEDGTFSLEVPAGIYSLGVATGVLEDDCYGCEYGRREQQGHTYFVDDFRLDGDRQETIRLPRPSVLSVTVVDPHNRPVAEAWVLTNSDGWNQGPAIASELFPGAAPRVYTYVDLLTAADGTAELEFIPGAGPATISVDPPPGTQLPSHAPFPTNATSLKIQLQDGPTLHGRMLQADGNPLGVSDAYLVGDSGSYPFGTSDDGYAVTAPAGRYRIVMRDGHDEEGESSDYLEWTLQSEPIEIDGDRTLDLNVPLGYARLWAVGDDGQPLDLPGLDGEIEAASEVAIADGVRATTATNIYGTYYDNFKIPVIGPSETTELNLDSADMSGGAYLAPGEDTIIAFVAGTRPGDDPPPTTTTTTTTAPDQPTITTPVSGLPPDRTTPPGSDPAHTTSQAPGRSGYWALTSDGHVYNFGDALQHGNATTGAVDLEPTPTGTGYWTLNRDGRVQAFGDAPKLGDVDPGTLAKGETPASLSATPSGRGYWVFTNRGRTIGFGDAAQFGDMSQVKLNGPVLGSVATPTGRGYYMVASDGGIFAFGDAAFAGSMGGKPLNKPVQSLVPDSDGKGYWLVASDGGIFAFDAPFRGSMGATKLNKPVVGMVRYGDGYLMVGADGGIFNFSTSPFSGSLGDKPPASPVVAVAALP
jgi:hypothetical protein